MDAVCGPCPPLPLRAVRAQLFLQPFDLYRWGQCYLAIKVYAPLFMLSTDAISTLLLINIFFFASTRTHTIACSYARTATIQVGILLLLHLFLPFFFFLYQNLWSVCVKTLPSLPKITDNKMCTSYSV